MAKLKKLSNANYLHDDIQTKTSVNEKNRAYIDRFVSENYTKLSKRFAAIGSNINSSGFGSLDKLNETLVSLYTNPELCFDGWNEANTYLKNKFTEKTMRVPLKKHNKCGELEDNESINENNTNNE